MRSTFDDAMIFDPTERLSSALGPNIVPRDTIVLLDCALEVVEDDGRVAFFQACDFVKLVVTKYGWLVCDDYDTY